MRRAALLVLLIAAAVPAAAQNTDIEALAGLRFNFSNPGARSLGMGGAFIGLADDASAAEANPAGLTILRKTEISIETRNYLNIAGLNTTGEYPDSLTRTEFKAFSDRVPVMFGSVVMPVGNAAIAAYFHRPLNYENTAVAARNPPIFYLPNGGTPVSRQECIALNEPGMPPQCLQYQLVPFGTGVVVDMQTWGLAGAWKMGNLSIGAGARYQEFKQEAATFRTTSGGQPAAIVAQISDSDDITWSAGFKWSASERFSVGGSYKSGPEFDAPVYFANLLNGESLQITNPDTKFHVPDVAGIGISFRPTSTLTINADAVEVSYSNLVDNFTSVYSDIERGSYESKDVTEYHVGAELFFPTRVPVAIRAGWWRDPAHQLRYVGPLNTPNRVAAAILYPGDEDQDHMTLGFGLSWPRLQIDAAYDTSDALKVGSLSGVVRF